MNDAQAAELAGRQFNRISRAQLHAIGLTDRAIAHRVATGRLTIVEEAVFGVSPVLDDDWSRWMGAVLTSPATFLCRASAAAAWGFWSLPREFETVTRAGSGGPTRHGGILVFRSTRLDGATTTLRGIPITTPERTLIDLAGVASRRATARSLRDAVRLRQTTVGAIAEQIGADRRRRGAQRLADALARYSGLPLERARSGAEVRALELLRDIGHPLPQLNVRIAGEEADLSWPERRLIIEIDGGPFHLDVGADAIKEARWREAGWRVRRIPSDDVYGQPERLLKLASG